MEEKQLSFFTDGMDDEYIEAEEGGFMEEEGEFTDVLETFEEYCERMREPRRRKKEIPALFWLAKEAKIDHRELGIILCQVRDKPDECYLTITLKKRSGGKREISIPINPLKRIQRRINKHILSCYWRPNKNVFGFSGGSIHDAIRPHLNAKSILCVDFCEAFPRVGSGQLLSWLTEGREVWCSAGEIVKIEQGAMSWYAARAIVDLTTYRNRLPQGAPTSPRLFDIVCKNLDIKLSHLAERVGGHYTRYADNIFFSMDNTDEFPQKVKNAVLRRIDKEKFLPHEIRTRKMDRGALRILGLNIIQNRAHNTRSFKRNLRLSLHHLDWLLNNGMEGTEEFEKTWEKLQGQMSFARIDTLPPGLLEAYVRLQKKLA